MRKMRQKRLRDLPTVTQPVGSGIRFNIPIIFRPKYYPKVPYELCFKVKKLYYFRITSLEHLQVTRTFTDKLKCCLRSDIKVYFSGSWKLTAKPFLTARVVAHFPSKCKALSPISRTVFNYIWSISIGLEFLSFVS
jgi:hypothetical protein